MRAVVFALPLLLVASLASAQPYVVSTETTPFVPVSASATQAQLQGSVPADNGRAVLPIGFQFPYFGRTYSQLTVTANGVAVFEPGPCSTCDFAQNVGIPIAAEPNGVLAPLWDDLKLSWPSSGIFYETRSATNDAGITTQMLVVEWRELNHWFATSQYKITLQLQLSSTGEVAFHYGPLSGSGAPLSATIGIESPDGAAGSIGLGCTPSCTATSLTPNQRVIFSAPPVVELSVPSVTLDSVATVTDGGTDLQISATTTIRNFSQADAGNVEYALFLSQDQTYSPATDIPMTPNLFGPLDIAPLGTVTSTATAVAPRPASGRWYVVALADPFSAFTEPDETNNSNGSLTSFAAGLDLVALDVSGPSVTGPSEAVTMNLKVENSGIDDAGSAPFAIKLLSDTSADGGGFTVYSGQVQLGATEKKNAAVSFTVPSNVPAGTFRWQLQMDPAGAVSEQDEANNVAVSGTAVAVSQNDLFVQSVLARQPATPFDPASKLFFGEPGRFDVTVSNIGGAAAPNATISLFISTNETFNALSDTKFAQQAISVAAGETKTVQITATLPTVDKTGAAYGNAEYFIIALAISPSDADALNDIAGQGPLKLFLPGPDLVVRSLSSTPILASGERFLITRRLSNAGTRDAGVATYRYFLSPNDIVTTGDVPVSLVDGGTPLISLAAGQDSIATEDVAVPENVPEGTYFLSAIIDSSSQVAEFDETNNAFAGPQVIVLGSSLMLETQYLQDAIVGRPYRAELSARGGTETITFAATSLPDGLALSADGVITGTPTQSGAHALSLILTSGARSARATAVLRVLVESTVLAVATNVLPPVPRELPYNFQLAAQGGVRPYRWELTSGALPFGISLSSDGKLSGTSFVDGGLNHFSARVIDGLGSVAERSFTLRVVASGALVLQTTTPPPAQAGVEYATDFYAVNANGTALATPLRWSVVEGTLPPGLELDPRAQLLLVRGVPQRVGTFPVVIAVEDLEGRSDTVSVIFLVLGSSSLIAGELPASVHPGDDVSGRLTSDGAISFRLASGELPPGVVLSEAGDVSGRVNDDAFPATYSFTASAVDIAGVERLGSFAIEVLPVEATSARRCGCSGTDGLGASLLLAAAAALRRRKQEKR